MNTAIITGASSGMGREFVKMTAQRGDIDEIWVIARREDKLRELESQVKVPLHILPLDLLKSESFVRLQDELEARKPNVTFLVNASGFGRFGRNDQIPLQDDLDMIDLNCKAMVNVTKRVLPFMPKGGRIIQVDSLSSFQPVPYLSIYGATKAFVLSYSRSLNVELKDRGVQVMAFCPGWVKTPFFDGAEAYSTDAVTYFNKMFTAEEVVRVAMKDSAKGKDVCVPGLSVKLQVLGTKLLPHKLVMAIWMKQQKH
ncbi:MAG: SDR family NAD(P)-dependent oxidoreductase [Clostridia bacterium]|nr:SDR family NAD(P)-dependent oxidoreductase [Clostridia bacterium]